GEQRDADAAEGRLDEKVEIVHDHARPHVDVKRLGLSLEPPRRAVGARAEDQAIEPLELLGGAGRAVLFEELGGGHDVAPERAEAASDQRRVGEASRANRDVEPLLDQVHDAIPAHDLELDLRVPIEERGERRTEVTEFIGAATRRSPLGSSCIRVTASSASSISATTRDAWR